LESKGYVKAQRGSVVVRDRKGLIALARSIYGIGEAEQERLTGWRSLKRP
jgi:hypothetical protein